jgi:FMN reductase
MANLWKANLMSSPILVGLAGTYNRPSRTHTLVKDVAEIAAHKFGFQQHVFDLSDVGPSLGLALKRENLDGRALEILAGFRSADALIIGCPTYKGSYPGLFKHLFDLLDPDDLRGKPVLLAATGGGDRHTLMVEHQLRPLFGFFMTHTLPTTIYASERDFTDYRIVSAPLKKRIADAVDEFAAFYRICDPVLAAE